MSRRAHKVFLTSADHHTGHALAQLFCEMKEHFSLTVGGYDRSCMEDLERSGVKVQEYDPSSLQSLEKAFKGHDTICIIPSIRKHRGGGGEGDEDEEESLDEHSQWVQKCGRNMISAAEKVGAKCAMLMSVFVSEKAGHGGERGRQEDDDEQKEHIIKAFHQLEQHFNKSRINHKCVIKVGLLMQTFMHYTRHVQSNGELPLSTGEGKFAPISLRDVARFSACVLSGKKKHREPKHPNRDDEREDSWLKAFVEELASWVPGNSSDGDLMIEDHRGKAYCLTGSNLVSAQELVEQASEAVGARIKLKEVSLDDARRILGEVEELDEGEVEVLVEQYCLIRKNHYAKKTHDYREIVGKEPMSVSQYFSDHASDFAPGGGRRL